MLNARHSLHATILDMHAATPGQAALTCIDASAVPGTATSPRVRWKVPELLQLSWDTFL
jgi:hypothetical protein